MTMQVRVLLLLPFLYNINVQGYLETYLKNGECYNCKRIIGSSYVVYFHYIPDEGFPDQLKVKSIQTCELAFCIARDGMPYDESQKINRIVGTLNYIPVRTIKH